MKKAIIKSIVMTLLATMLLTCSTVFAKPKTGSSGVELNFRSEEMHVLNGDIDLYGEMYLPVEEKDQYPLVIMCHGLGSNANAVAHHAKFFATNGFASYIFDVNCGGISSRSGKADGDMHDLSPLSICNDLSAVIDQLKTLPYIDTDHIFLGGVSMGGFMAAAVSAMRTEEIKAIILQCPAYSLCDRVKGLYASEDEIPEDVPLNEFTVGKQFVIDAETFDIYDLISNYKGDVLICHGDKDEKVPISYIYQAVEIYENATLSVYEGADHGFGGDYKLRSEKEELEFLLAHLD